jgi:hypothetical protein
VTCWREVSETATKSLLVRRKSLTLPWRRFMSSTKKTLGHPGTTYNLSNAAAEAATAAEVTVTAAEATVTAAEAAEATVMGAEAAEAATTVAGGEAASEFGGAAAAAAVAAGIGAGGTAYGPGAITKPSRARLVNLQLVAARNRKHNVA